MIMKFTKHSAAWTSEDHQRYLDCGWYFASKQDAINSLQSFAEELILESSNDEQRSDIYHGDFIVYGGGDKIFLPVSDFYQIAA